MSDRWTRLAWPAMVSALTFCLGYILSAANLNGLRAELRHLHAEDARLERSLSQEVQRMDARLGSLSGLVEKLIAQNQQFIELLRVQNELLQRYAR